MKHYKTPRHPFEEPVKLINGYRPKTLSKEFFDDEIIGIWPDKTVYLKEGVRRRPFNPLEEDLEIDYLNFKLTIATLNTNRIALDNWDKFN